MIQNYAPSMKKYSNNGSNLNSGYGSRIFEEINDSGTTQFDYIIQKFKQDKDTRQAIIHIRNIKDSKEDIELMMNSKDIPCTLTLHFQILYNKLVLIVNMRSQDAMVGLVYDTFTFTMLQELLYIKLKNIYPELSLGKFIMFASNEHIYENWYEKVNNILENNDIYKDINWEMPSMQEVDMEKILRYECNIRQDYMVKAWDDDNSIPKYWRDILNILAWNRTKDDSFLKNIDISLEKSINIFKGEIK
jgi:thymidylate synthase